MRQAIGSLGKFCGSELPATVTSTQSKVMVQFLSDMSVAHNGFRLEWRAIGILLFSSYSLRKMLFGSKNIFYKLSNQTEILPGCGGQLRKSSGSFTSPNYPLAYPMETECIWEIETEPGTRVELTVNNFEIESSPGCYFDYLKVSQHRTGRIDYYYYWFSNRFLFRCSIL